MADQQGKVNCGLCGQSWDLPRPGEGFDGELGWHLITRHPLEVMTNRRVVTTVTSAAYRLGELLADALKGARR